MKKIINGRVYDTNTAVELGYASYGNSGDFTHWCETLYKKKTGEFFIYGIGGSMSKYAESSGQNSWGGGSRIIPISLDKARKWAEEYMDGDRYEEIFGRIEEDDGKRIVTYSISKEAYEALTVMSSKRGMNETKLLEEIILSSFAILIEEANCVKKARFISTWEDGIEISSSCMVNEKTKEVYDIEICENCPKTLGQLEREEVEIDGKRYHVFQTSDITEEDDEYWYE